MKKLVAILLLVPCIVTAQDLPYAKDVVRILCSEKYKGRGYVEKGDQLAADFIGTEFEKAGLKKFSNSCFQEFTLPVNTFPGKMIVKLNDHVLIPSEDFLIDPASPAVKGKFKIVRLGAADLLNDERWKEKVLSASEKVILIESFDKTTFSKEQLIKLNNVTSFLMHSAENPAKATAIVSGDKLTWSTSTTVNPKAGITFRASAISDSAEEIELDIENKFVKKYQTKNVVGYIEGKNKDSLLVYTAHYDHLGMMGSKTMFPGANDNASGVAFLLNLVKYYSTHPPAYTTVFIAFSGEEIGLLGSKYFTEHPLFDLKMIKFLINFDMAGTGDDGIQVVNGKLYQRKFDLITTINKEFDLLKQVKIRGEACNSDHCMFHSKGVPCFFIYTLGGIQAYHDVNDKAETLPFTDFVDYFTLITTFIERL